MLKKVGLVFEGVIVTVIVIFIVFFLLQIILLFKTFVVANWWHEMHYNQLGGVYWKRQVLRDDR